MKKKFVCSRRGFLGTVGLLAAGCTFPETLAGAAQAAVNSGRTLVVVHLEGGNDGLNMVVPFNDRRYWAARPNLCLSKNDLLPIDDTTALSKSLFRFQRELEGGNASIIQGVGYPESSHLHFRSSEIWLTGTSAQEYAPMKSLLPSPVFPGELVRYECRGEEFEPCMMSIARSILQPDAPSVVYVSMAGFDTHYRQQEFQQTLLSQLDAGIAAFQRKLHVTNSQSRACVMVFSEFGRSLHENRMGGTEHGGAGPVLVVGGPFSAGLLGTAPDLDDLDRGGLKFRTDFRSIYATLFEKWLNTDSTKILGQSFPLMPSRTMS